MKIAAFSRLLILTAVCFSFNSILNAQWVQRGSDIIGQAFNDNCGRSISMSEDASRIAIGSHFHSGSIANAGEVRVFSYGGGGWTQLGSGIEGKAANDRFGWSVALSRDGNTLAVGATHHDAGGIDAGQVSVYRWDGTTWNQLGSDITGGFLNDYLGYSVALSSDGNTMAVGVSRNDDNGTDAGKVTVYSWDGTSWNKKGNDVTGALPNEEFGFSVEMSGDGNTFVVGADRASLNGTYSGQIRAFEWDGSSWSQKGSDINGSALGDFFGFDVSINKTGDVIAGGAIYNDGNVPDAGHVKVYAWDGSDWQQKGADIQGEAMDDLSGSAVSLSNSGDQIAIGAYKNDATGTDAGQIRVFEWNANAWQQVGMNIDGAQAGEYFGTSAALSGNGMIVGGGAPINNQAGNAGGAVRVYQMAGIGVPEDQSGFDLNVYPNPAHCLIRFENPADYSITEVSLINTSGQIISTVSFPTEISLDKFPEGVYHLKIVLESDIIFRRLVIQR